MKKFAVTAALSTAIVLGTALPASALWCQVADKPVSAGSSSFNEMTANKAGNLVFKGAFVEEDGVSFFIRGGDKSHTADFGKQFGFIPETAECNGPEDHGVIDPWGVVCGEDGEQH